MGVFWCTSTGPAEVIPGQRLGRVRSDLNEVENPGFLEGGLSSLRAGEGSQEAPTPFKSFRTSSEIIEMTGFAWHNISQGSEYI
jgi:hypothetical protein